MEDTEDRTQREQKYRNIRQGGTLCPALSLFLTKDFEEVVRGHNDHK